MKKLTLYVLATLALSVWGAAALFGQESLAMRVKIPFEFSVANTTLPAGEYYITEGGSTGSRVLIRSVDGREATIVNTVPVGPTNAAKSGTKAEVLFRRYGGKLFLSTIWPGGLETGRMLLK